MISDNIEENKKVAVAVLLLPYVIAPGYVKNKAQKTYRASISEVKDSFLLHVPEEQNVPAAVVERREKFCEYGRELQPYIIVAGDIRCENPNYFCVIEDVWYKFGNILEAIDVLFKCFHVFCLKYPAESEIIWLAIQIAIYNIQTEYDRVTASVSAALLVLGTN